MQPFDVEALLARERRASLPLARQLLLLIAYVRRWLFIAATLFVAIAPAEAAAAQERMFIIPAAAFAVGCSIAVAVCALTVAVYLLLGSKR
ncbi:MAG: hypothetical protein JF611_05980 [Betaproteobacteria bacterium]|nr:hypothetical protein [Betaproteobacteria bacterium]